MKTESNESIKVPVILASIAVLVLLCLAAVSPTGGGGGGSGTLTNITTFGGIEGQYHTSVLTNDTIQTMVQANHQNGTNYTIDPTDRAKFVVCSNSASFAVTIPQAGTSAFTNGFHVWVKNLGAGLVTITPTGCNIDGLSSIRVAQYGGVHIATGGTNYYAIAREVVPAVISASTGNSYTTDASQAINLTVRLLCTTNFTLANPTGGTDGQSVLWEFQQDSTNGQHTITLGANFALGSDITAIVLSTNVNKRDFMSARFNSASNLWYVLSFARGY